MVFLLLACLTSCSFNKIFYQPEKIPAKVKNATITNTVKDSSWQTIINFGDNFQPTFTDSKNNLLHLDYSIKSYVFKDESGHNLNGWFIKPIASVHPDITILFLHGNGGNIVANYPTAVQLVKRGFQVFIFDYSGYGFSEGKPTRKNVLDDATSALKFLCSQSDVRDTKVVVYGQSLGGHLAVVLAQRNEQMVDGLVAEGAFSSHKDIAADSYKPLGFAARILVKEQYSAFRSIRHFHKPVLIIHSTEDKVVPIAEGKKIYANANEPKSFYEIKHEHIEGLAYYADSISSKIKAMVIK